MKTKRQAESKIKRLQTEINWYQKVKPQGWTEVVACLNNRIYGIFWAMGGLRNAK